MKPSAAAVLALLRERESVTDAIVRDKLHQTRLAARVAELRAMGLDITCDRSEGFGRYKLREAPRQLALLEDVPA